MTRTERVFCAMFARISTAPRAFREAACDEFWRALVASDDRRELDAFALMLFSLDGVARHVPGDDLNQTWRRCDRRPCEACGRAPCAMTCIHSRRGN